MLPIAPRGKSWRSYRTIEKRARGGRGGFLIFNFEFWIVVLLRSGPRRLGRSFAGLSPYYVPHAKAAKDAKGVVKEVEKVASEAASEMPPLPRFDVMSR